MAFSSNDGHQVTPLDLSMRSRRMSDTSDEGDKPPKKRLTWRPVDTPNENAAGCSGALDLRVKRSTRKRRKPRRTYDFGTKRRKRRATSKDGSVGRITGLDPRFESTKVANSDEKTAKSIVKVSRMNERCICRECGCQWKGRKRGHEQAKVNGDVGTRRQSQRLVIKNYKLPFSALPRECKLRVFACLPAAERARVARVCQEWRRLVTTPGLWAHVDLEAFDVRSMTVTQSTLQSVSMICARYAAHCARLSGYMQHLVSVSATIRSLRFTLDVSRDDWMLRLLALVRGAPCSRLASLEADWTQTARRPAAAAGATYCCLFNKVRAAFRQQRRRAAAFQRLLEQLTIAAPSVAYVRMPFDWSARSVLLLCRWHCLRELRLSPYLNLAGVPVMLLDVLLASLPLLVYLELGVCVPLYSSTALYTVAHQRLQTLDISASHGFFLRALRTPELRVLHTRRVDWRGPLVADGRRRLTCIHTLLRDGATKVTTLNRHRLQTDWKRQPCYAELDQVLARVCPCAQHALTVAPPNNAQENH